MATNYIISLLCIVYISLLCHKDFPSPVYAAETKAEPRFPEPVRLGRRWVKIVSESVDERLGSQTSQEYHDIRNFRSVYITSKAVGKAQTAMAMSAGSDYQVQYIDGTQNIAYSYRPFKCEVSKISDLSSETFDKQGNFNFNLRVGMVGKDLRYFGVLALWKYAHMQPVSFEEASIVYSAAKQIHRDSLVWSARLEKDKLTIKMYFIQHEGAQANGKSNSPRQPPSLEMIQIYHEAEDKKRLLRTINILSLDYAQDTEMESEFFQPPVGFGCFTSLIKEGDAITIESRRRDANKWTDWAQHSLHAELEVTATSYEQVQSNTGTLTEKPVSQTYNVEVAQSKVKAALEEDFIEMIRLRNTGDDHKVVINHLIRVLYSIDMRTGTCEMSHISPSPAEQGADSTQAAKKSQAQRTDELYQLVSLKFGDNGLKLDIGVRIFQDPENLHFVRKTPASASEPELHYYEGDANDAFKILEAQKAGEADRRKVRIIQTYTQDRGSLELHSLTIWVLDEQLTRILESYLINVIDARSLASGWPDEVKMFDVSEECYLDNERMVQNHDYAWFELKYPAQSQVLNRFTSSEQSLKDIFYSKAFIDVSRVPRIEVLFEEDSFIVRILELDLPATELVYDKTNNIVLKAVKSSGDLSYQATDLQHCGHYCRMHLCTVMSYCSSTNACILSSRPLIKSNSSNSSDSESTFFFSDNTACDTYKIPPIIERNNVLKNKRLHNTISKLQHQNYGIATLPKVPEELALPLSETGLTFSDFMAAVREYEGTLEKALESENMLPDLYIPAMVGEHYFALLPSKFELENDPMREFNIHDESDDDEAEAEEGGAQNLPRFHEGLPGSRYNLAAPATTSQEARDETNFRKFSGLTYDQCAMACADSRCGSFSFCKNQDGDCVLSNINSTGRARTLGVVQDDQQCFIYQRDFLRNFDKFESVLRPQVYTKTSDAADASECALNCVSETSFKCLSFEFCDRTLTQNAPKELGQCYYQIERHLPGGKQARGQAKKNSTAPQIGGSRCDHYSRSYLADFVRLESRKLADSVVEHLKTSYFSGLSVFSCAEKCATGLLDCSGFQFCHLQDATTSQQARECTTIESKITKVVLETAGQSDDTQTLVDEKGSGRVLQAAKYLQFDDRCQVFALSKNSAESHLRDLAFVGLVVTKDEKAAEGRGEGPGSGMGFFGGFFLFILIGLTVAGLGCGVIILRDNNAYVQQRVDQLRILIGV